MTVAEAAKILEVKPSVVYELCAKRLLGHRRIGIGRGVIRISQVDLDAYIASCTVPAREPRPIERPAGTGLAVRDYIGEMLAERERKQAERERKQTERAKRPPAGGRSSA